MVKKVEVWFKRVCVQRRECSYCYEQALFTVIDNSPLYLCQRHASDLTSSFFKTIERYEKILEALGLGE